MSHDLTALVVAWGVFELLDAFAERARWKEIHRRVTELEGQLKELRVRVEANTSLAQTAYTKAYMGYD